MKLTDELIKEISLAVHAEAETLRTNAGYGGAMDDGGARDLEETLETWMAGLTGKVPKGLKEIVQKLLDNKHPEYAEYQRLKKKFG